MRTHKKTFFWKNFFGINPLNVDLVAYYTHDELTNTTRVDCSPNGLDALVAAGTVSLSNDGILNGASEYTGVDRLSTVTDPVINGMKNKDFTICGWFRMESKAFGSMTYISLGSGNFGTGTNNIIDLFWESGGDSFGTGNSTDTGSAQFFTRMINGGIPLNAWVFAAVTYIHSTRNLEIRLNDTNNVGSVTLAGNQNAIPDQLINFGRQASNVLSLHGDLDEWVFYDRALSTSEKNHYYRGGGILPNVVAAYFFEGILLDEGPNGLTFVASGGIGIASGIKGNCIEFDGTTGSIETATDSAIDALREASFSVTVWAYIDAAHTGAGVIFSISNGGGSNQDSLVSIFYDTGSDVIAANIISDSGVTVDTLSQQIAATIPRDTFISIQVTYDEPSGTFQLRLNDQAFTSTVVTGPTDANSGQKFNAGALSGANSLDGRVDELTINNESLSDLTLNTRFMNGQPTRPYAPGRAPCAPTATDSFNDDFNDDFD